MLPDKTSKNLLIFTVLAILTLFLAGCGTALQKYETGMAVYIAGNNAAADLFDEGKVSQQDLKLFRDAVARPFREALDAYASTISPDGKTADEGLYVAVRAAMTKFQAWLITTRR